MFQMVEWHFRVLFFFLNSPKCDLHKVDKEMFKVFPWYFELIFGLLIRTKCDLNEVQKAMFQVVARNSKLFSAS